MIYLLFNPLSKGGHGADVGNKLEKKCLKKGVVVKKVSVLDIRRDIAGFVSELTAEDKIIIIGGDGTLHQIVNSLDMKSIPAELLFYKAGSGNDYARGHKGNPFSISQEVKDLPHYDDGINSDTHYLNGVGIGVDAEICYNVNIHNKEESYLKTTIKSILHYKPFSLDIKIDGGEVKHFDDVYFFVCMNGKYIGGGMNIAPHAVRSDEWLELYVVTSKKKRTLMAILLLVYLGLHEKFHKVVHYTRCHEIDATCSEPRLLQSDGEVSENVQHLIVKRY